MRRNRVRRGRVPAAGGVMAALLLAAAAGCGGEKLESRRLDREIAIDGTAADWDGALVPLEGRPVSFGVMNDDEYLYLCFVTDDEALARQVVLHGLTVAFVPEGTDENDALRVLFPVGRRGGPRGERPPEGSGRRGEEPPEGVGPPEGEGPERSATISDSVFHEAIRVVELQGPGGRAGRTMDVAAAAPVLLAAGRTGPTFVYELRAPLAVDDLRPAAIGVAGDGAFELRLETPEIDFSAMRERMDRRRGGGDDFGGPPDGFGGPGGMGGGMGRGGGRPMAPEPLDVRLKVRLAPAP